MTDPQTAKAPVPFRRRLWVRIVLWILGGLAALILCLVLCIWLWYRSDGDLVAARAYAKSKGIPTTWAEKGLVLSLPERIDKWKRISQLSRELPSYQSVSYKLTDAPFYLMPFAPATEALRQYHASFDQAKVAELMSLVDGLGEGPLVLQKELDLETMYGVNSIYYDLQLFFQERVVLADREAVTNLCQRQLHLVGVCAPHCRIDQAHRALSLCASLDSVAARMADLGTVGKEVADRLDALADELVAGLADALSDEVAFSFGLFAPTTGGVRVLNGPSTWKSLYSSRAQENPFLVRVGRYRYLSLMVDQAAQVAVVRTGPALVAKMRNYSDPRKELRRDLLSHRLALEVGNNLPTVVERTCMAALRAHLVAAEIRGEPWPIDWFDPAGELLRPVERDGKVIGAYTLGIDGEDKGIPDPGGISQYLYFPLHGPLEPPKP